MYSYIVYKNDVIGIQGTLYFALSLPSTLLHVHVHALIYSINLIEHETTQKACTCTKLFRCEVETIQSVLVDLDDRYNLQIISLICILSYMYMIHRKKLDVVYNYASMNTM